jgi:hypothetical protein
MAILPCDAQKQGDVVWIEFFGREVVLQRFGSLKRAVKAIAKGHEVIGGLGVTWQAVEQQGCDDE